MKKAYFIPLIVIISILTWFGLQSKPENVATYHIALADPKQYTDGVFTDIIKIQSGRYQFSFVSNGDSPQILSITLNGKNFSHTLDFRLNGTLHNIGISRYYTWNYFGKKDINVSADQEVQIMINPHGNTLGSVSVYLRKV